MYVAIDLGGTKTLVVLLGNDKQIIKQIKFETPKDYSQFLAEIKKTREDMALDETPEKGAIGTRGILDRDSKVLITDSILEWENVSLAKDCEDIFGCEFLLENDSKLAGLSEARSANSDHSKVLYITISTGIGSALIVDGKLDQDTINSEIGKWVLDIDDQQVSWEDIASGKWITETYGMRASELEDENAWTEISKHLAIGFVNAVAAYGPDLIIIGGGVGTHFHKYEDKLKQAMQHILPEGLSMPEIIQAQHPEEAVIFGCYELVKG